MTSTTSGRERRRYRRIDVTLPARFTGDGKVVHAAIVHSLGAEGMFLETPSLSPIGANIRIVAPLPDGDRNPIRVRASVLYHNRRGVAGSVQGFGLQFLEASQDLKDRIERFLDRYEGQVPTDEIGGIAWPVEVPSIDPGWHSVSWWNLDPEGEGPDADDASNDLTRPPLERFLGYLDRIPDDLGTEANSEPSARVALHFRGKALAPSRGLPREWLLHSSLRSALAAQLWAIEILEEANWRLIELGREHFRALEGASRTLDSARDKLGPSPASGHPAESPEGERSPGGKEAWNEIVAGLAAVSGFLGLMRINLDGLNTLGRIRAHADAASKLARGDADGEPTDEFLRIAQDAPSTSIKVARPPERKPTGAIPSEPTSATAARGERSLARHVVGALVGIALASVGVGVVAQTLRSRPPASYAAYLPIARQALSALEARDEARLAERIAAAKAALGGAKSEVTSLRALELGANALAYHQANSRSNPANGEAATVPWGPGKPYPDLASFQQGQERNRARAEGWIRTSEQMAARILEAEHPFQRERAPEPLESLEAGQRWLNDGNPDREPSP